MEWFKRSFRTTILLLPLVPGCASGLTPRQSVIEKHFDACQPEGPSTRLVSVAPAGRVYFNFVNETDVPKMVKVWVTPEGRFYIEGHWTDPERVEQCMQARFGYQFRTP